MGSYVYCIFFDSPKLEEGVDPIDLDNDDFLAISDKKYSTEELIDALNNEEVSDMNYFRVIHEPGVELRNRVNINDINPQWLKGKMEEFKISSVQLSKDLFTTETSVSRWLNGLSFGRMAKVALYYYFQHRSNLRVNEGES